MSSMLRGGRNGGFESLAYGGCSCHNSKAQHRAEKHRAKRREQRAWSREAREAA